MARENASSASTVVIVQNGGTDAGYRLARDLLAAGRRVAVVGRYPGEVVRVMHGYPADRVMVIAADVGDPRQWKRVTERVLTRFGRLDTIVRADDAAWRASA